MKTRTFTTGAALLLAAGLIAGCSDDGAGINGSDRSGDSAVGTSQDVAVSNSQEADQGGTDGNAPHAAPTTPAPEGPHPTVGAGAHLPVMTVDGPQPHVEARAAVSAQGEKATLCRLGNGFGIGFITAAEGTECHIAEQVMGKLIAGHKPAEDARDFTPKSITVNGRGGARAVECVPEPVADAGADSSAGSNARAESEAESTAIACRGEGVGVFLY